MKWIRPNNGVLFVKSLIIATSFFICHCSAGQSDNPDTSIGVIETVADTTPADELPNYFDSKTNNSIGDTIELRHVPSSVMDSLKSDDAFWYANAKLIKKQDKQTPEKKIPHWLKSLTWIIIVGAFLGALIWYLTTSSILIFSRREKTINSGKQDDEMPEDIFSINYQREIMKAVQEEEYRLAIRLMFLRLLRNLSNRNLIQYTPNKTNVEYLSQLFSSTVYNDFFRLTRNYEYAWYGKFDVSRDTFKTIEKDFENFDRQLL